MSHLSSDYCLFKQLYPSSFDCSKTKTTQSVLPTFEGEWVLLLE